MGFLERIKNHTLLKEGLILLLLLLLVFPVILPYLRSGYFPTHDGEWAVVRLADMFRSVKDLQFPVRYSGSLNFGYGYPLFNFAYPFPYYAGLLFVFLQFGFVGSIKALFVTSILLGAFGMYLLSKKVFKSDLAGVASALFYTYLPYHLVDLFVRGSLGESVAFGIFPFILFFTYCIFTSKKKALFSVLAGLFLGILILSHNIMAVLFIPVLFTFILGIFITRRISVWYLILIFLVGFGTSAFFFIPALMEKGNILLSLVPIADRSLYFVNPLRLLWSPFGYGTPTESNPFTYQIGIPLIFAFFIVLYLICAKVISKTYKQIDVLIGVLLILTLVFTMMLFSFTHIVWESLPLLSEINYPWTLLSQIGLVLSFIVGYLFIQKKAIRYIGIVLTIGMIGLYGFFAKPLEFIDRGDMFYLTNPATTTSSNELMPVWVTDQPTQQVGDKVVILDGRGQVDGIITSSNKVSFTTTLEKPSKVRVQTIYYPGWKALVNQEEISVTYNNSVGVMDIFLPQGKTEVQLLFSETPLRMISNIVSAITFLSVITFLSYSLITFKKHEK